MNKTNPGSLLFTVFITTMLSAALQTNCYGADPFSTDLLLALKDSLSHKYPQADVKVSGPLRWSSHSIPDTVDDVMILGEDANGTVEFQVRNSATGEQATGNANLSIWMPAKVAVKRIYPGQELSSNLFEIRKIDVSSGIGREYRGVLFPAKEDVKGMESVQTILEGQFLVSSAIQRKPDIKRGETVQVHLLSGEMTISTSGTAEESGYVSKPVRIMTNKGKRELQGKLLPGHIVEVTL